MRFLPHIGFATLLCVSFLGYGQEEKKSLEAVRLAESPTIDGNLDDPAWLAAPIATDFLQRRPNPGKAPSQRTEVKVLYDDDALYVGAMMYDDAPDSILHQLSERDRIENTDWFGLWISCFQDGINAFEFFVTPDGVQIDAQVSAISEDFSWNAVWQCNTSITEEGWIAEFKIPYSAIRFPESEAQTWDVNFTRVIRRHREQNFWQHVDPEVAGFINQSGELTGIEDIDPPIRLFFYPYISGYYEQAPDEDGNLQRGNQYNGGMDVKLGLTDAFTLDATLIPDFGQVQSDNLVLNLSPFEVAFSENRQFFKEGTELFNKGDLFYSRRVGGPPINADLAFDQASDDEEVSELPATTQLLNAIKISGRNAKGTGIGFFNAISGREYATLRNLETGQTREIEVSPLTNYNILVVDQNLPNNSYFTLTNTNVTRDGTTYDANVIGTTFELRDKKNRFSLEGSGAYNRKFNAAYSPEDEGYTWNVGVSKIDGNFNFGTFTNVESEHYDPNDLGLLFNPNEVFTYAWMEYNVFEPFWKGRFNRMWSGLSFYREALFEPAVTAVYSVDANVGFNTRSFDSFGIDLGADPWGSRDYFGPRTTGYFQQNPSNFRAGVWLSSDYRRRLALDVRTWNSITSQTGRFSYNFRFSPRVRVNDRLFFSYVYSWQNNINTEGYAFQEAFPDDAVVEAYEGEIIYAQRDVVSHTQVFNLRYIFTNRMSLTCRLRHYWSTLENKAFLDLQEDGSVTGSAFPGMDDDGTSPLDQSFNTFNVDLVYRWVFSPGSELSVVWKRQIVNLGDELPESWTGNFSDTVSLPAADSFSIKVLYFVDFLTFRRGGKMIEN